VEPFLLTEPRDDSPVLVEVPHAGLALDPPSMNWTIAPTRSLARDADLYVDSLFAEAPALGASLLQARTSRYVIDLNRSADDYDGQSVEGGSTVDRPRGVVWRLTSEGYAVLRERLPQGEFERRLDAVWRPYHHTLARVLERKRERFGFAVLLCAHSMPNPRPRGLRTLLPTALADVVPGTRGRTSAAERWIDLVDATARAHGLSVEHDVPYRGGYSTGHYGRPDLGIHAVQVELARRLYMDEDSLMLDREGSERVVQFVRSLLTRLVTEARTVAGGSEVASRS